MISQLRGVDPSSWIWPFHFLKTAFFGPMVDNKIEDGIIFIYPLCICNNLFNFNSLDNLNIVRHERTLYKVRITVQKMRAGPSEPACRSRLQTT